MSGLALGFGLNLTRPQTAGSVVSGLDMDFVNGRYALNSPSSPSFPAGWTFTPGSPPITAAGLFIDGSNKASIVGLSALLALPHTIVIEADLLAGDGVARTLLEEDNGALTNRTLLYRNGTNGAQALAIAGGVAQTAPGVAAGKTGARTIRMAARMRAATYNAAVDGVLGAETAYTPPTGVNQLWLGSSYDGAAPLNGYVKRVRILGDVSDAALIALTA